MLDAALRTGFGQEQLLSQEDVVHLMEVPFGWLHALHLESVHLSQRMLFQDDVFAVAPNCMQSPLPALVHPVVDHLSENGLFFVKDSCCLFGPYALTEPVDALFVTD